MWYLWCQLPRVDYKHGGTFYFEFLSFFVVFFPFNLSFYSVIWGFLLYFYVNLCLLYLYVNMVVLIMILLKHEGEQGIFIF